MRELVMVLEDRATDVRGWSALPLGTDDDQEATDAEVQRAIERFEDGGQA